MLNPIPFEPGPATGGAVPSRRDLSRLLIGLAVAFAFGAMMRMPTLLEANDISRWCTVWSLLERGTYAIDECPWQARTQDKVKKPDKLAPPDAGQGALKVWEYRLAPRSWKEGEPTERFYSSKPALLPTLIAGLLYPARVLTGVPLDRVVEQAREPRYTPKTAPGAPGGVEFVLETPTEPAHWPVYVFYLKPVLIVLNTLPFLAFLVLYSRFLDRNVENGWVWAQSLSAAAFGTYLYIFNFTLNNHTVAAFCAFFALVAFQNVWAGPARPAWSYAAAGFFAAFCACNEIPAALFGLTLALTLLARFPRPTLTYFVPAAALPCLAFLVTQFLAFGQFRPVYEEFGTKSYEYAGSYWTTPLELDLLNREPESYPVYLFHMTFGHHGIFSLSPIFLFSCYGAGRQVRDQGRLRAIAAMTLFLTVAMLAFYTWNPKARNYGGSTQGLRWLFWLIPFWLLTLPAGLDAVSNRPGLRRLAFAALLVSVGSVGYAVRSPWAHPWLLDALEHLNLYPLKR